MKLLRNTKSLPQNCEFRNKISTAATKKAFNKRTLSGRYFETSYFNNDE